MTTAAHRLGARALAALLPDLAELPAPRYRSLAAAIAALLLDGRIAPGAVLPSERNLADTLRISRSTSTAAYQQLAADDLLIRRRGSGSYLTLPAGARVSGPGSRVHRPGRTNLIDLSIAAAPGIPAELPGAVTAAAAELVHYRDEVGYQPYGIRPLRQLLADRYTSRGVPTEPEQILLTNGAQHGLDLILRLLLHAGDRVVTELPTYPGGLDAIRAHGGRVLAVPFAAAGGWDLTALTGTFAQSSPRLAMLIPDFNNPTGQLIDTEQRSAALTAARRAGCPVVVDESFVDLDLRPAGSPLPAPMAALDPTVFSLGSLSKPIWAGLRVGWIRADVEMVSRLAMVRARSDMGGSLLDQLTALNLLRDYEQILTRRRIELRERRDALLAALASELPHWQPSNPAGGLSSWVRLDAPAGTALTHLLEQRGILLTPGSRFTVDGSLERYLRIPFALPAELLTESIGGMARAWAELDRQRMPAALVPA